MTASREDVVRAFPEIERIEDDDLREGVIGAWMTAIEENRIDDLIAVQWFPKEQARLGIGDEGLVDHVRDVTQGAIALAELLIERRGEDISMDTVIAGGLIHDVSKLYEHEGDEPTDIEELLGHPHFGVHVTAQAGLPVELMHIALSHSGRTAVDPATLEAALVRYADEAAADAIRRRGVDDLRDV